MESTVLGQYTVVGGKRIILNAEAVDHINAGDKIFMAVRDYRLLITSQEIKADGYALLGSRKIYRNAGKIWASIPEKYRFMVHIESGDKVTVEKSAAGNIPAVLVYPTEVSDG